MVEYNVLYFWRALLKDLLCLIIYLFYDYLLFLIIYQYYLRTEKKRKLNFFSFQKINKIGKQKS